MQSRLKMAKKNTSVSERVLKLFQNDISATFDMLEDILQSKFKQCLQTA